MTLATSFLLAITPATLPPVDRCPGASFAKFRATLERVVKNRDVIALKPLIAPDMVVDFGGGTGWKDFYAAWGLGSTGRQSKLWGELASVMALGCAPAPDGSHRVMPGLFERAGDDIDAYDLAVARPGTVLRGAPSETAAAIATLNWHVVTIGQEKAPEGWAPVTTKRGTKGWLRSDALVSAIGYRLTAEQRAGRWQITAFVAGD